MEHLAGSLFTLDSHMVRAVIFVRMEFAGTMHRAHPLDPQRMLGLCGVCVCLSVLLTLSLIIL